MADLRLLLLVSLFSLSLFQGEGIHREVVFTESCPGYQIRRSSFLGTLYTFPIEDTNQTIYVRPKENGTPKLHLRYGDISDIVDLTTQLRIRLWKDGARFCAEASGIRKCNKDESAFNMISKEELLFTMECPSVSHTSGPPEDVSPTSPSSVSAVNGDKISKTFPI